MADSIIFRADEIRELAFGSISTTYTPIGGAFQNIMRQVLIQNFTDQILRFSFDPLGLTPDHLDVAPSSSIIIDVTANKTSEPGWFISRGTVLAVRDLGVSPTVGFVSVSAFYGKR